MAWKKPPRPVLVILLLTALLWTTAITMMVTAPKNKVLVKP